MADRVERDGTALVHYRGASALLILRETARVEEEALHLAFESAWAETQAPARVDIRLTREAHHTKLSLTHTGACAREPEIADGWARTLSGLKTFVETGTSPKFRAASP